MRRRLGCLSTSGVVAALSALAVILAAMLVFGGRLFSPGPLNASVGAVFLGGVRSHSDTGGRCSACHAAFWSSETMTDRCLVCHAAIGDELQDPQSLHGALLNGGEGISCRECHSEHLGAEAFLTVIDPETFPHNATGYALEGHRQFSDGRAFSCSDCHGADLTGFDPLVCADCHGSLDGAYMEVHQKAFGLRCLGCHDGRDTYGQGFDHDQTALPLEGEHTLVECADCHIEARSRADLQATPADCSGCHRADDAHDGQFGQDCAACHTPDGWDGATFDHDRTEFYLVGRHHDVDCRDCYAENVYQGTPQDCFSCHRADDAHDGQFGQDCAGCHTPDGWDGATFDHDRTAFRLTGRHEQVNCRDCHAENVYQGTPQDCFSCHSADDAHDGQFGQDCAACHTTEGWDQVTFDHGLTAFELTGAHVRVDCLKCHVGGASRGIPTACSGCHDEPVYHLGLLGTACADCHSTDAWAPARFGRSHTFPTSHGEGGTSPCRICHPDHLASYTCYGCHEHDRAEIEEEHREEGINDFRDCTRCHPTGQEEGED